MVVHRTDLYCLRRLRRCVVARSGVADPSQPWKLLDLVHRPLDIPEHPIPLPGYAAGRFPRVPHPNASGVADPNQPWKLLDLVYSFWMGLAGGAGGFDLEQIHWETSM